MTTAQRKTGDLIYVPSQTLLHRFDASLRLERPAHLLITAAPVPQNEKYYQVSHEGTEWYLNRRDAYDPKEDRNGG